MVLVVLWFVVFGLVLIGYRPGGPIDLARRPGRHRADPDRARRGALAAGRARRPGLRGHRVAGVRGGAAADPVDRGRRHAARRPRAADAPAVVRGGLSVGDRAARDRRCSRGSGSPAAGSGAARSAGAGCSRAALIALAMVLAAGSAVQRRRARQRAGAGRPAGERLAVRADRPRPRAAPVQRDPHRRADRAPRPPPRRLHRRSPDRARSSSTASATAPTCAGTGSRPRACWSARSAPRAIGEDAWERQPGSGWATAPLAARRRSRPRRAARRRGADAGQPIGRRGPRAVVHRGRAGPPLPDHARRRHAPPGAARGRPADRRDGHLPLARATSTTGCSPTGSSARSTGGRPVPRASLAAGRAAGDDPLPADGDRPRAAGHRLPAHPVTADRRWRA